MKKNVIPFLLFFLMVPSLSYGGEPMDQLKVAIDKVLVILNDPANKTESDKDKAYKKTQDIINQIFDFKEMSRITLSKNWNRFSETEKNEFSKVFSKFLTDNYLGKIWTGFEGEKFLYLGQKKAKGTKALVSTKLIRKSGEIPVDYLMILRGGNWRVYDIRIEGVSMMKNYYIQFREILHKESPEYLINQLKDKINKSG